MVISMIEEEFNTNKIVDNLDDLKVESDANLENLIEEVSSTNAELIRVNRQLEDISENLREKSDSITIGHFSIGVFCICLAVIIF